MTVDLVRIGRGLPFATAVPALQAAVRERGVAVVQAPPGTGKTTLAPPAVAEVLAAAAAPGRVVVVQPRRIAARAAARRLAHLSGTPLGELTGFTVRGERRVSAGTRIEFCTPGVLLRRLLADPDLPGTAAVILDEVHERGIETDLLVGMLAELRGLRELVLVAMSATLDAPRFAALLTQGQQGAHGRPDPAAVVDCPSALHPLEVRWLPPPGPRTDARGVADAFLEHVAVTTAETHHQAAAVLGLPEPPDMLVFGPGLREIERLARRLRDLVPSAEVLELHGRLAPSAQDRVTAGPRAGEAPRIVVSTSLAESSLTVPGVRVVVDAGLAREPRRDAARGMTGLVTVAASRDAAIQRAGRAARQGPGLAVRCYDETTFAAMPAHVTPEVAVADLVGPVLTLACWGSPRGVGLALPDALPAGALHDAEVVLRRLGAIDEQGRATGLGARLAAVPADPRLARALLDGTELVGSRAAAEVVAALADDHRPEGADLPALLRALRRGTAPGASRWKEEMRRLRDLATRHTDSRGTTDDAAGDPRPATVGDATGLVVALAHPDRVARRAGAAYLLASGTRAALPPGSLQGHEWLAVADVSRAQGRVAAGTGAVIRSAAPLSSETAELAAAGLLTERTTAAFGDHRVTARRVRALGAIELSSVAVRLSPEDARTAVESALATHGLSVFTWSPAADGLRRRLALLHRVHDDPWPDMSDAALTRHWREWLGPEVDALAAGGRADRIDLHDPLRRLLPWPQASRLGELAPERLAVPSGRDVRIDYPAVDDPDGRPVVAVKLQECFGWAETPTVAGVAVLFHLLSPAGRPLAVTDDLASFWSGPYAQVRAEMRGRYPKHPWPEDPWTAPATARTRRRP
ncbi:ATP-dependent helicase HrpB [Ornithinimicrobium cryptoxanthini]|uniref:ATP-dependent helicase HrpB n=1 Tax=Ornithinimicrobium cryptoxanthini TaxID=2934161 RepID=A0ABY4YG71_9MICO|nr:ATP-dependent helicase HrpB [Ornithinimicrobium cryptoxanthini]USQ75757.1 ATP-dependent helicase HrpB [Ornithinimicrobium cryptoxanthini]